MQHTSQSPCRPTWFEIKDNYHMGKKIIPGNEFRRCLEGLAAQGVIPRREVNGRVQYGFSPNALPKIYAALGK